MGRGRSRWASKSLRRFFPLKGERSPEPRFDGWYGTPDQMRLRFSEGGDVELGDEVGTWQVDRGEATPPPRGSVARGHVELKLDHDGSKGASTPNASDHEAESR